MTDSPGPDLSRLISAAQATTLALNNLNQSLNTVAGNSVTQLTDMVTELTAINASLTTVFPQFIATAPTATGGSGTLPASPVGFLQLTIQGVGTVKIAYYSS